MEPSAYGAAWLSLTKSKRLNNNRPPLAPALRSLLAGVSILPRRLSLDTPGVHATVPMLRGVWGAALHDLDAEAYTQVFEGVGTPVRRSPGYVLRPASRDPADAPAVEWMLIGAAIVHDQLLWRAWDVASGMGLGPERQRFRFRAVRTVAASGDFAKDVSSNPAVGTAGAWTLDTAAWPLDGDPAAIPCRLWFSAPLRILRSHRLITTPTLIDIVEAAFRRIECFVAPVAADAVRPSALEAAGRAAATPWSGRRLDLVRWSANQQAEVELGGVAGHLDLPEGPGDLWPLLAALQWLHVGKGSTLGLGQLRISPAGTAGEVPQQRGKDDR